MARPLPWAALAAAVPVLTLLVTYVQVDAVPARCRLGAGRGGAGGRADAGRLAGAAGGQPGARRHPCRRRRGGAGAGLRHGAARPVAHPGGGAVPAAAGGDRGARRPAAAAAGGAGRCRHRAGAAAAECVGARLRLRHHAGRQRAAAGLWRAGRRVRSRGPAVPPPRRRPDGGGAGSRRASPSPRCWWRWRSGTASPAATLRRPRSASARRRCRWRRWRWRPACCNSSGTARCWQAAARLLGGAALFGGAGLLLCNPAFVPMSRPAGRRSPPAMPCRRCSPWLALRFQPAPADRQMLGGYAVLAGFVGLGLGIRLAFHPDGMALDAGTGRGWRAMGLFRRLDAVWRRADGGGHRPRRPGAAAGGAGHHRAGHRQGVPDRHGRPGRAVAGAVVPRAWGWR